MAAGVENRIRSAPWADRAIPICSYDENGRTRKTKSISVAISFLYLVTIPKRPKDYISSICYYSLRENVLHWLRNLYWSLDKKKINKYSDKSIFDWVTSLICRRTDNDMFVIAQVCSWLIDESRVNFCSRHLSTSGRTFRVSIYIDSVLFRPKRYSQLNKNVSRKGHKHAQVLECVYIWRSRGIFQTE